MCKCIRLCTPMAEPTTPPSTLTKGISSLTWSHVYHIAYRYIISISGGSRILKEGVLVCDLRVGRVLGGSGGMPPQENFEFLTFWDCFWCILEVKLQKVGRPTAKLGCCVSSPQRRDSASGRRDCKAASYPCKGWENKRSHTDSISPSLAAEGAMRK